MGNIWLDGFFTDVNLLFYVRLDGVLQERVTILMKNSEPTYNSPPIWSIDRIVDELNGQIGRRDQYYFMKIDGQVRVFPIPKFVDTIHIFCLDENNQEVTLDFLYYYD